MNAKDTSTQHTGVPGLGTFLFAGAELLYADRQGGCGVECPQSDSGIRFSTDCRGKWTWITTYSANLWFHPQIIEKLNVYLNISHNDWKRRDCRLRCWEAERVGVLQETANDSDLFRSTWTATHSSLMPMASLLCGRPPKRQGEQHPNWACEHWNIYADQRRVCHVWVLMN